MSSPDSGPPAVAIGGGHGLAVSLGALRGYTASITGIVSVADDGGSSGRLREQLGIPAPGDLRRCLGALLPDDSPLRGLLEYRFPDGELGGHAFGNLLIAAAAGVTGDFAEAVEGLCRLLGTVGRVIPATSLPVVLRASVHGRLVTGQVQIMASEGIDTLSIAPLDAPVPRAALAAIAAAHQIVIGPGSLYTSVIAALAPRAIAQAVSRADATVIYVANLAEQRPETAGYDLAAHLEALARHGIVPDVVLADLSELARGALDPGLGLEEAKLASANGRTHDVGLLSAALSGLLGARRRRQPRISEP